MTSKKIRKKAARICDILIDHYGDIIHPKKLPPIDELVLTILSQNTTDVNSQRAFEKLKTKCGSSSTLKEFRRLVGKIVEEDETHRHMPDYGVSVDENDVVVFRSRGGIGVVGTRIGVLLRAETYEVAKSVAPGWDIYVIEAEWREWMTEAPRDPDSAFIGFCRTWYERRGTPA